MPSYAWALIFWAVFSAMTMLGVNVYGEIEYYFGMFKFGSLIVLFLLSIVANVGGFGGDYVGFRYWTKPTGKLPAFCVRLLWTITNLNQDQSSMELTALARFSYWQQRIT